MAQIYIANFSVHGFTCTKSTHPTFPIVTLLLCFCSLFIFYRTSSCTLPPRVIHNDVDMELNWIVHNNHVLAHVQHAHEIQLHYLKDAMSVEEAHKLVQICDDRSDFHFFAFSFLFSYIIFLIRLGADGYYLLKKVSTTVPKLFTLVKLGHPLLFFRNNILGLEFGLTLWTDEENEEERVLSVNGDFQGMEQ